jgi:hypothetical protein
MSAEWPDTIKKVYVLCKPDKEPNRFKHLIPHLLMKGIPKDRLQLCAPTWSDTLEDEIIFKVYNPFLKRGPLPAFSYKSARLSKGEISLNLNFYAAIQSAAKDLSGNESIMILESDVFLRRDFVPRLNAAIADLSGEQWDYISLSEGVGTRPLGHAPSYYGPSKLYPTPHKWVFRCTDSMILGAEFVKKLTRTFLPFKECLDWELNFQMILHQGKSMWLDPPIAEQGSYYFRDASALP